MTPGILLITAPRVKEFLSNFGGHDRVGFRRGMSGRLCRCGRNDQQCQEGKCVHTEKPYHGFTLATSGEKLHRGFTRMSADKKPELSVFARSLIILNDDKGLELTRNPDLIKERSYAKKLPRRR